MDCLAPGEPWGIVPMFTDEWSREQIEQFECLLGGEVLQREQLTPTTDREAYFRDALKIGHIFVDPDTGVSIENRKPEDWPKFISLEELSDLVVNNPNHLTLVYDQSYSRQRHLIQPRMERKLARLLKSGVAGFGYLGQACFLILSCDEEILRRARQDLLTVGIPEWRLVG